MARTIALNGFGRIGRSFLRSILADETARSELRIGAINVGPSLFDTLAHSFKYDSLMGAYPGTVSFANNTLTIDDLEIPILSEADPTHIDWKKYHVEWVVEASGRFTSRQGAQKHLDSGAAKVLITAPAHDEDITIIPGVNDASYKSGDHHIVSLGSCTTNCFAPVIKVINDHFGLEHGMMTTTHSYTNNQVLLDVEHKDARRGRAAAINIIPTKTGAAQTVLKVFPELTGKLNAVALRVPVAKVSIIDFTFTATKPLTPQTINNAFHEESLGGLKGIVLLSADPLVSSDYANTTHSAIIDGELTQAVGSLGKVFAWYDNEFGYACRLKDFLLGN